MNFENKHFDSDYRKIYCSNCGKLLKRMPEGNYICLACGHEEMSDYEKVRDYLDEYGKNPAPIIQLATGVPIEVINKFVDEGRLELSDDSITFLKCKQCGADIKCGNICPACAKAEFAKLKDHPGIVIGEVPKNGKSEKMRFINQENLHK